MCNTIQYQLTAIYVFIEILGCLRVPEEESLLAICPGSTPGMIRIQSIRAFQALSLKLLPLYHTALLKTRPNSM